MGSEIPSSDSDWDYPLTDEDLRAIDSAFSSAASTPAPKRHALGYRDDDGASVDSSQNPPPIARLPIQIKFGGRIIYSRTVEEVERAAKELLDFVEAKKRKEGQCILGLDIEWRPTFRRGVAPGKAAVMQICGDNICCHVLHIIHSGIPKNLQSLLEDCASLKVGVCIANDAAKVFQDHNVSINTLGDLSDLANQKLGGDPKKWSLSSLTEMLICRQHMNNFPEHGGQCAWYRGGYQPRARCCDLPKPNKIRLGNWEVDVLSMEQIKYAATDAYVSWYLYQDPVIVVRSSEATSVVYRAVTALEGALEAAGNK
ncbi:hypothetical protein DH2020_005075 [Rehmannia glutinosa]|uniref:3'-5' exonuclease n=1 Tax=Rehmannia glutinosa TaxID=99300 RepID=A0ABR0XRD6_REHGL